MQFKNSFLQLYEELSSLLEQDDAVSQSLDITELDRLLEDKYNLLVQVCNNVNNNYVSKVSSPASIILLLQDYWETKDNTLIKLARVYQDNHLKHRWNYFNNQGKNPLDHYAKQIERARLAPASFDIAGSFLCFNFTLYSNMAKTASQKNEIIQKIIDELCLNFTEVEVVNLANGFESKLKNNTLSICVRYVPGNGGYSPFAYKAADIENASSDIAATIELDTDKAEAVPDNVDTVIPFSTRLNRAKEFIKYFTKISKNNFIIPSNLNSEDAIKKCAFHVVDLVSAYTQGDSHIKNCMISLLDILGAKIGHNNPVNRSKIDNWKSVQYLHNACYQEAKILEIANKLKVPLKRNPVATGLNGNNWYLFAQKDSRVTSNADFIYVYNDTTSIGVDAKIYLSADTESEASDLAAHDAVFLIEYILDDDRWGLKKVSTNIANTDNSIITDVEKELNNFIIYLNKNKIQFYMIDKYLQPRN